MFNRVTLLALLSIVILALAGCGSPEPQQAEKEAEPAEPPKPAEPPPTIYELTKDDITSHPDWTSRNIGVLGVKLGDVTRNVEKNLGSVENTRTLLEDYLTVYQDNGIFVYTFKNTGKVRKIEVNENFAKKVTDEKLKKLLSSGDLNYMREILGPEQSTEENAEDNATEYVYDNRGIRFVQFKVGNKKVNAIRLSEIKKATT